MRGASLLWKYRFGGEVELLLSSRDCVLLLSDGELRCLSSQSGSLRWSLKGVRNAQISGDRVLVLSDPDRLACVNIDNGREEWSLEGIRAVGVDTEGGRICASSGRKVTCLDSDGGVRWTYEMPSDIRSISVSGELSFLACEDGFLYCLREYEGSPVVKPLDAFLQPPEEDTAFEGDWVPSELL